MTSQNIENLVETGSLKTEPARQDEFNGLLRSAKARLVDARNVSLAIESRFDFAYNASHFLALAQLSLFALLSGDFLPISDPADVITL